MPSIFVAVVLRLGRPGHSPRRRACGPWPPSRSFFRNLTILLTRSILHLAPTPLPPLPPLAHPNPRPLPRAKSARARAALRSSKNTMSLRWSPTSPSTRPCSPSAGRPTACLPLSLCSWSRSFFEPELGRGTLLFEDRACSGREANKKRARRGAGTPQRDVNGTSTKTHPLRRQEGLPDRPHKNRNLNAPPEVTCARSRAFSGLRHFVACTGDSDASSRRPPPCPHFVRAMYFGNPCMGAVRNSQLVGVC